MIYTKKQCVWLGFLLIGVAFLGFMADDFTDNIYTLYLDYGLFFWCLYVIYGGVYI